MQHATWGTLCPRNRANFRPDPHKGACFPWIHQFFWRCVKYETERSLGILGSFERQARHMLARAEAKVATQQVPTGSRTP